MALRRVALAAAALSIVAIVASAGGVAPGGIQSALGIRSMTVDAPFQAPEPTADVKGPAAPGARADGTSDLLASVDAPIALLALVAVVGFGVAFGTLRAASAEERKGTRATPWA